jgi:hypothetical protein
MKNSRYIWLFGLIATLIVIAVPVAYFWPRVSGAEDNPQAHVQPTPVHTSHADLMTGPYETPQDVTKTCLGCHPQSADQVMHTTHWTWESQPFDVPWREDPVTIGKINQINNFCISSQGNQKKCMAATLAMAGRKMPTTIFRSAQRDCLACRRYQRLRQERLAGIPLRIDPIAAA